MTHQAIYRKWRPMVFEDIVGQEHITRTLQNQIMTGHISHAYLFCGTRGTGKTTAAKVLSRAVNCLNPHNGSPCNECAICRGIIDGSIQDITEIDAASNNGVDNIRDIREDVQYVTTAAKYRVYIIDEVHMLSSGAFNALLKTLEEPPEYVIFILATTEAHKVPQTILSRCQRFDFKRIDVPDIIRRMREIAMGDGLKISDDAYELLARLARGSMRDGLSILERIISSCKDMVTAKDITEIMGLTSFDTAYEMTEAISEGEADKVIKIIGDAASAGQDLNVFADSVLSYFRDLMICSIGADDKELDYSKDEIVKIKAQSKRLSFEKISRAISLINAAKADAKWSKSPRVIYELAFIKLTRPETDSTKEASADRIASMEKQIEKLKEAVKNGVTVKTEEKKTPDPKPVKKKKKPSIKLYNPIPDDELGANHPYVKLAKNWRKQVLGICNKKPYLRAVLDNRDITIDNDGIILLFNADEVNGTKKFADEYLKEITDGICSQTGLELNVKTAFKSDLDGFLIDIWALKDNTGAGENTENQMKTESDEAGKDKGREDPLTELIDEFGDIIELSDESEFVDYNPEDNDFSQQSLDDDSQSEEFLEPEEKDMDED